MRAKTHARRTKDVKQNADGSYEYAGEYLRFADTTPRKQSLVRMGVALGAAVVATVVPGFLPTEALSGQLAVTMSWVVQLVAGVACVWGFARLALAGERVRPYLREETADRLPSRAVVAAAFAAFAAVGDVVRLAVSATVPDAVELAFLACELIAAVGFFVLFLAARSLRWESCA